jgi:hypothetical protein
LAKGDRRERLGFSPETVYLGVPVFGIRAFT